MIIDKTDVKIERVIEYNRERIPEKPDVSVIIVTYNRADALRKCLTSLMAQTFKNFEIVVVDNASTDGTEDVISGFPVRYLGLSKNYWLSAGRNVGVNHAKGGIVCFLDDDAVADPRFIESHFRIYDDEKVIGARGRIIPVHAEMAYNAPELAPHYDLGGEVIPSLISTEGNSSFRKEVLQDVGGFNDLLFGYEGTELTYRLIKKCGDKSRLVYSPEPIIYHDYCTSLRKLIRKSFSDGNSLKYLKKHYPNLMNFQKEYYSDTASLNRKKPSIEVRILLKIKNFFVSLGAL